MKKRNYVGLATWWGWSLRAKWLVQGVDLIENFFYWNLLQTVSYNKNMFLILQTIHFSEENWSLHEVMTFSNALLHLTVLFKVVVIVF
jgi:hypothetical protein